MSDGERDLMTFRANRIGKELGLPVHEQRTDDPYAEAFRSYLLTGIASQALEDRFKAYRAMDSGAGAYPGSPSGYFTPVDFEARAWAMLKQFDELFDETVITRVESKHGGPWASPNLDDTSAASIVVPEGNQTTELDSTPVNALILGPASTWRSGQVKTSIEYLQDSGIPFDALLADCFGVRFARGIGASNVSVLMAAATRGAVASGSESNTGNDSQTGANSIGSDDLTALIGSVDPAYLANPKCAWVMNFTTLVSLLGLRNMQGSLVLDIPYIDGSFWLLGKPIRICPSMDSVGANKKPIAFGDLSRFILRIVKDSLAVKAFPERYAEYGITAWEGYLRCNAGVQLTPASSQVPIKYLQNAAQ